jgi:GNAT superfamily N-acetyltransferase
MANKLQELYGQSKNKLGSMFSSAMSDYSRLPSNYPNAQKFMGALSSNISKNVPTTADLRSPSAMLDWSQAAALNAPMLGTVNPERLNELVDIWKSRGIDIQAYPNRTGDSISLSKIVVPKTLRNKGIGSAFLNDLISHADESGAKITLTPSTDFGASSISRLKDFYKKAGFVENKGKNKDYEISDAMYRLPKSIGVE